MTNGSLRLEHGIKFLDQYCFDPDDGRMWFQLNRQGQPIRKRRYAFSESFAAIAYGEFAQASGSSEYATKAKKAFLQFVQHNLEPKNVQPKFTTTRPMQGIGFPMITLVTAQQLRESIDLDVANEWIDRSIGTIRDHFLKPDRQCVMEQVGPNGEIVDSYDGRTLNPGHAIECAWFLMNEGQIRSDSDLIQTGCQMLQWMWDRGWDEEYGGLRYFVDIDQKPVQEYWHDMKFWWPHNETIIATLMAWKLTGDEQFSKWHELVHNWAHEHFADIEHGEWWGYLHRDGSISSTAKGNLWKGPFHLPRMQLVCWRLLDELNQKGNR